MIHGCIPRYLLQSYALLMSLQSLLLHLSMAVQWSRQKPAELRNHYAEADVTTRPLTSAAELFYLHHLHSCAAAATHAQKRHAGQGVVLAHSDVQMLLLELFHVVESLHVHFDAALQVLQFIWDFFAVLQSMPTPLEVASLALFVDQVSPWGPCDFRGLQEWFRLAIACLTLILRCIDWHVPCYFKQHRWICCALSALSMHSLWPNGPCTVMAIFWPTFGKRARSQSAQAAEHASSVAENDLSLEII